jgi:hypothetical protein
MVLVTEEALAMLLGPPRVFIFLAVLRRFPLPLRRRRAVLDGLVLLARVALLRHRHNARVHHLPATREVALRVEMLVKLIEQPLDQPGPRQLLAKQPQRRAVDAPERGLGGTINENTEANPVPFTIGNRDTQRIPDTDRSRS